MWRSLVARFFGVEEVVSSNLAIPTNRRWASFSKEAFLHMKVCCQCKEEKTEAEFSRKGEGFQCRCKACFTAYHQKYYENNKTKYLLKNRNNKNRQRERLKAIAALAKQQPCQDCGGKFHPWVMEFDHREGTKKVEAVGNLLARGCTDEKLQAEIEKCDVVCANCHRMRTFNRHILKKQEI